MTVRQVRFDGEGAELAGELVLPTECAAPCPGVVLLHGAGEGERGHYRVLAECFADVGVASLIFDRRGHGESGGPADMNLFVLAKDAEAALAWLSHQREVDPARVGLWGYSNGAWVATLAASRAQKCAFLVLTGAAGVSPARAEVFRRTEDLRSRGISDETVAAVDRAWTLIFDYIATGERPEAMDPELRACAGVIASDRDIERLEVPDFVRERPELDSVPRFDRPPLKDGLREMGGMSPDMAFDPIPTLEALSCPVLVVQAEHDANVAPSDSLARFRELAGRKGSERFRVEVLARATHDFAAPGLQPGKAGAERSPDDYFPGYLDMMANWIAQVTMRSSVG